MKTNWTAKLLLVGATLWCGCSLVAAATPTEPESSAEKISQEQRLGRALVWLGATAPTENENQELLQIFGQLDQPVWQESLEKFLVKHPASPWAASLHHAYALFCRNTGRTTKALNHWEAGWALAKNDGSEPGRKLGGTILSEWMSLLSSLGRVETLRELAEAGDKWAFTDPQQREKFIGAKSAWQRMQAHPEISYRCGTFALKALGQQMQPGKASLESLVDEPSPLNGFTVEVLLRLAETNGLNLVAVHRPKGAELIVPSVVHWRQNHYAAILQKMDDNYLVSDPTFGTSKWLPREVIDEEASGVFLIPQSLDIGLAIEEKMVCGVMPNVASLA